MKKISVVSPIYFEEKTITIQEILVWIRGQAHIKATPKMGVARQTFLNESMHEIFKRHLLLKSDAPFVFHRKGKPLLYSVIAANYNRAWKKAGLKKFHATHQLRYSSAQASRMLTGSIDGAKAVTGHRSLALANQYSEYTSIDQNRSAVEKLEVALKVSR